MEIAKENTTHPTIQTKMSNLIQHTYIVFKYVQVQQNVLTFSLHLKNSNPTDY